MKIFAGSSNVDFSKKVCAKMNITLSNAQIGHFSDGEVKIIVSENVRDEDCYIIQSTCRSIESPINTLQPDSSNKSNCVPSVNDNLM